MTKNMKGSRAIGVTMGVELVERCDRLRREGRLKHWSLKRFLEMILEIGMDKYELMFPQRKAQEYQTEIKCEEGNRLQAADCETAPEAVQRMETKIIPFPGVTLAAPDDDFQTQLDGFLREMGYIE